jgi:hypothetical protein
MQILKTRSLGTAAPSRACPERSKGSSIVAKIFVMQPRAGQITKPEWKAFWRTRVEINHRLLETKEKLRLLESADEAWNEWKLDLFARLAAGATIEDEGRIAG